MSDRTPNFFDLSFKFWNSGILFTSSGTRSCGLGLLRVWMVHQTFACLTYWWGGERYFAITISTKQRFYYNDSKIQ